MTFYSIKPDRAGASGWKILEIADVPYYVELSFLIGVALMVFSAGQSPEALQYGGLWAFAVFFSLLVHETGHALISRAFGLRPVSVTLYVFGGLTFHPPTTHGRSLVICLAGPAFSVALGGLAFFLPQMFPSMGNYGDATWTLIGDLIYFNLIWICFNLLPIYPLDGGQSLFHILSFFIRETRAIVISAYVSLVTLALVVLWLFYIHYFQNHPSIFIIIYIIMFFQQNVQILQGQARF